MATKKITKIISTENGENFVADIEDIENRITQNSSNLETAKQELSSKCNEALNEAKAYTDQEKANLVKKSGDILTGNRFTRDVDNDYLFFNDGTQQSGASLVLYGKDSKSDAITEGSAELRTKSDLRLQCKDNGALIWNNKNIVRSVNGAPADVNGNINIHSIPNYSAGISININENNTTYTCPADGIIFVWASAITYVGSFSCYINSERLLFWDISGSETGVFSGIIICGKGDICLFDMIKISSISATFYPFK